jgi:ankyrin repeat protein
MDLRLADAAREGNIATFQALDHTTLRSLAVTRDEDGRTLLHTCAAGGSVAISQLLIDAGHHPAINLSDEDGWTPLHSASSAGHEDMVKMLLSQNAQVEAQTNQKRTPLHYAASKGHANITQLLLEAGADPSVTDILGNTPLHRSAACGKLKSMQLLIKSQAKKKETKGGSVKVDVRNKLGETPLLLACQSDHRQCAVVLVAEGADLEAESEQEGETPLKASEEVGGAKFRDTLIGVAKGEIDWEDMVMG